MIGPDGKVERADAMICHAFFNETVFEQHFVEGYRYIVPVRDPISWIQSAVSYFGITKSLNVANVSLEI